MNMQNKVKELKIKIKKSFVNTGKEITVVNHGRTYKIKAEKINGLWMGVLYNEQINGLAVNRSVIEKMIETDESII
ncbi:hypothetical protein [Clostridium sp.]|uniref:hypothetical protein n=1 Tax=Clostridium sp. TaxID=1506 RepID=UPI00399646C2